MEEPNLDPQKIAAETEIFQRYSEELPQLILAIQILIESGHTPANVREIAKLHVSEDDELVDHAYLIAAFISRSQPKPISDILKRSLKNLN